MDRDRSESGGGFLKKRAYIVPDSKLENLGISEYTTSAESDGSQRTHKIHILPVHPDDAKAGLDVIALRLYIHYDVGVNGGSFLCPKWMAESLKRDKVILPKEIQDGRCPICEKHAVLLSHYQKVLNKVTPEERMELWNELKNHHAYSGRYNDPKPKKYFCWVVDASSDDAEDRGVRFYQMPATTVYEDGLLEQIMDTDTEDGFIDIVSPVKGEGAVFQFKRAGKGLIDTTYTGFKIKIRNWSIEDDTEWLKQVPLFWDVLKFHTYDEIAEAFGSGVEPEKEKDEDVEEELAEEFNRTRRRGRKTEEKDDDDDEAEETTKRKRGSSRSKEDDSKKKTTETQTERIRRKHREQVDNQSDNDPPEDDEDDDDE